MARSVYNGTLASIIADDIIQAIMRTICLNFIPFLPPVSFCLELAGFIPLATLIALEKPKLCRIKLKAEALIAP